ncbi:glycosyltransferase [Leifsonia soli]|uniref:dTDP-L-rhamnose 4-epimerase n=1 Tax=Leifsonia soli TaxID=582665 RepID=A0A852T2A5_9MICO|nr:dTDP-L-rhamnose 4-epimerase [Leifsonia soli]
MTIPIDVVFPCLNEAEALPVLLAALPPGYRAIVVDNGSTDGSADVALLGGAVVVSEPRRGYGAAVHAGLTAATSDLVIVCDADGTIDPAEFDALVAPVRAGTADLAVGRRRPTSRQAWPVPARVANVVLAWMLRSRTGLPLRDLGPVRATRRAALLELEVRDKRSGYPVELVLRAHRAGWRLSHVDMAYRPRIGRSKVTGSLRGYLTAVRDTRRRLAEAAR